MLLELFPVPRRYAKIPGALSFALLAVTVLYYAKKHTQTALLLMIIAALLLIIVYIIKIRQTKEFAIFLEDENSRLAQIKGAEGPPIYIETQEKRVGRLRNADLAVVAKLNLASAYNAAADGQNALRILWTIDPERALSPVQRMSYYSQALLACMFLGDDEMAKSSYGLAVKALEDLNEYAIMSFISCEINYRLYIGEYELALSQIKELPQLELDPESKNVLKALKAKALFGVGKCDEARSLAERLKAGNLLPSNQWLIKDIV